MEHAQQATERSQLANAQTITIVAQTHAYAQLFQPQTVYSNSETSSLHQKSKLRNVWGQ